MPGRKALPVSVIEGRGNTHMGKQEKADRRKREVQAPTDDIKAPDYLTGKQKRDFRELVRQMLVCGMGSNFDVDSLASFFVSRDRWIALNKDVEDMNKKRAIAANSGAFARLTSMLESELSKEPLDMDAIYNIKLLLEDETKRESDLIGELAKLTRLQDLMFKQMRAAANDNGLTITSRAKIVLPAAQEPPKNKNKFEAFAHEA